MSLVSGRPAFETSCDHRSADLVLMVGKEHLIASMCWHSCDE
jgi:hypothetical protein